MPEKTSPKKLQLIRELGADVHVIHGSREDTADAAWAAASAGAGFYASHVYNPLFLEGTKTFVYEIFEQLGGRLPACLVLPVGNGTLLLGAARGIAELAAAGHLERRPRLVAVQAERCAPIAAAFSIGKTDVTPIANEGTAAEGIAIAAPRRGAEILAAIRELDGYVLCASEESIRSEHQRLAKLGIHMELTSAATFAAFAAQREEFTATTVLPVCGAGVKSL